MNQTWWKPLTLSRSISVPTRRRLEIALSVAVTALAVVGLSRVVRPDPAKLAAATMTAEAAPSSGERPEDPFVPPPHAIPPRVPPEFAEAVARADLGAMNRLYTKDTPLDDMLTAGAETGEPAVVTWLLDHDVDVHEAEDSPRAPILLLDRHPDVVARLLAAGTAEPTLTAAAGAGAENAVARRLADRADVNPPEGSPLSEALASTTADGPTKERIAEKLLAAGADPNRGPGWYSGYARALTPAVSSCEAAPSSCVSLVELLIKHHARADAETLGAALSLGEATRDVALRAVLAARLEPGAVSRALAQMHPDADAGSIAKIAAHGVDWAWHDGEADAALPLLAAVQRRDRDAARALLDAGAPADRHYKSGECALAVALDGLGADDSGDYARIVELLVARGADVNRRLPDGRTPLFAAAESGNLRVLTALLDRGARVNERVLDDTALDAAEQNNQIPAARVLHARGGHRARRPLDDR
jgi:hypothetical protein